MNRINRIKSEKNFTVIPNVVFKSGLSLRAIGLLTYILHLPNDWILYKTYLYDNMPEGRDAIKTAWKELEEKGFIVTEKTTAGKGKLPEINYFVYDSPVKTVGFQSAETPQPETRTPETIPLLRTKKLRTKKLNSVLTTVNTGEVNFVLPEREKAKTETKQPIPEIKNGKPENNPPDPEKKQETMFQKFIAIYDKWYKGFNDGVPPNYTNGNGNAAKSLIVYFKRITAEKSKLKGEVLDEAGSEAQALKSWEFVLNNWHVLDNFLQGKTRLLDINSNIQNIITSIKNGNKKPNTNGKQSTGGDVSAVNLAQTIAGAYSGNRGQ